MPLAETVKVLLNVFFLLILATTRFGLLEHIHLVDLSVELLEVGTQAVLALGQIGAYLVEGLEDILFLDVVLCVLLVGIEDVPVVEEHQLLVQSTQTLNVFKRFLEAATVTRFLRCGPRLS